jgi:alanine racemase
MKIATIAIGYADGFNRLLSNGVGEVFIAGKRAKVVGKVCMDLTMVDVSQIACEEGDEVEIFGKNIRVREIAEKLNTIPYEVLTSVSQRVKRIYTQE